MTDEHILNSLQFIREITRGEKNFGTQQETVITLLIAARYLVIKTGLDWWPEDKEIKQQRALLTGFLQGMEAANASQETHT